MKAVVYWLIAPALLFVITAVWMEMTAKKFKADTRQTGSQCPVYPEGTLPGGFTGRIMALEFARSACDVEAIVGDETHENRGIMRQILKIDTFFILGYWLMFATLGFLISKGNFRWALWLAIAVIACATGAAIFDFIENSRANQVLDTPLAATTSETVAAIRFATMVKWGLSFVTALLLAVAFFNLDTGGARFPFWVSVVGGISFLAGALVGFYSLFDPTLIHWAVKLQLPALLCVIILVVVYPRAFLWKG